MATCNVYLSGVKHVINADPKDKLSTIREKLGRVADDYDFVYYNHFAERKAILNERMVESTREVHQTTFDGNTMIMTAVRGSKTELFGMSTDWLYNRHAGVRVSLYKGEEAARRKNAGKFEPLMLTDIYPSNPLSNAFYQQAVICEQGSVVTFDISSWGAAGFGYSITSNKDTICDSLYIAYGNQPNRQAFAGLSRYQSSANMIEISHTPAIDISTQNIIHYQEITVTSWRVTGYTQDGHTYRSDARPPQLQSSIGLNGAAMAGGLMASSTEDSRGFCPGSPGGDTYVSGRPIKTGAPERGPVSNQQFGSISDISEDDRHTTVLGTVVFYFFVFEDREAANRVIHVLNTPNHNAIALAHC